jgi:hypothetical protein
MGILVYGRHPRTVRYFKCEAFKRDEWFNLRGLFLAIIALQALSELDESLFELAPEDSCDAKRSQIIRIHRGVKAVATQMSVRIQFA